MDCEIINLVSSLLFSAAGILIAVLEFISNSREKKKIKREKADFEKKVAESNTLLNTLCEYSDLCSGLQKTLSDNFDTVTLSNCDSKEMVWQCNRIWDNMRSAVSSFEKCIRVFDKIITNVLQKEKYLPNSCVLLALSMEEVKCELQIKTELFREHLSRTSWENIMFTEDLSRKPSDTDLNNRTDLEESKKELYNSIYSLYLESIEQNKMVMLNFEKYEKIKLSLSDLSKQKI